MSDTLEKAIRALILIHIRELDAPEKVRILGSVGFKPSEIAEMLDLKANTVAKNLQRQKGADSGKKASKKQAD